MIKQKEQDQQTSSQTSRFYQNKKSNNSYERTQSDIYQQNQYKENADRYIKQKLSEGQQGQDTQQSDFRIKFEQQMLSNQPNNSNYNLTQNKMINELSSVNSTLNNYGSDLLFNAVNSFDLVLIEKLLKVEGFNAQIRDNDRNTHLHICMENFTKDSYLSGKIAKKLLKYGAKPNSRNKEGWCPIHLAARKGSLSAIKFAASHNVSIILNIDESNVNTPSNKANKIQSINKSTDKCELEQKNKQNKKQTFNLKKKGGPEKWSLLHIAANLGHVSMLEFLFNINYDMTTQNILGQKAKQVAIKSLILHKLIRKYENLWLNVAIFSDDEMAQGVNGLTYGCIVDQISNTPCSAIQQYHQQQLLSRSRTVINEKRNVKDLKHLIEQTMQKKQTFQNNSDISSYLEMDYQNQSKWNSSNNFQANFNNFIVNGNQNIQSNNPKKENQIIQNLKNNNNQFNFDINVKKNESDIQNNQQNNVINQSNKQNAQQINQINKHNDNNQAQNPNNNQLLSQINFLNRLNINSSINISNNFINSSNNLMNASDNVKHKKLISNTQFQIRNDNEDDFALGVEPENTQEDLYVPENEDFEKNSQKSNIKRNINLGLQQKEIKSTLPLLKDTELTENEFEECTFEEQKSKQNKFQEQFQSVQNSSNQMVNHQKKRADWNIFNERIQKEMQINQQLSIDKFMNEIHHIQDLIVSLTSTNQFQQLNNLQFSQNNPNQSTHFQFQNQILQNNTTTQSFSRSHSYNQLFSSNQSTLTKQRSKSKIFESQWLTPLPSQRQIHQKSIKNQYDVDEVQSLDSHGRQNNVLSNYSRLQEILKLINYLHLIHLKLVKMDSIRFQSEVLPMNIYILSEFLYFDKNSQSSIEIQNKQRTIIPNMLLEIFDHFLLFIRNSIYYQGEEKQSQSVFSPRGLQNFTEVTNKQINPTSSRLNYHQQSSPFNGNNNRTDKYNTPNSSPFQRTAHSPHESRSPFMNKHKLNTTPQNTNKIHYNSNTTNINTNTTLSYNNKTQINNNITPQNPYQNQQTIQTPNNNKILSNNVNNMFSNSNTVPFHLNKTDLNTNQISQNIDFTSSNCNQNQFNSNTKVFNSHNCSSNQYYKSSRNYSNSPSMYSLSSDSNQDSICSDNEDSIDNRPIQLMDVLDCLNRILHLFELFGCKDLQQRILSAIKIKVKSPIQFFETEDPLIVKDQQRSFPSFSFTSDINQADNTPDYKKKRERNRGGGFASFSPYGKSNTYTLKEQYVNCHKEQHYTEKILFDFEAFQTYNYLEANFAFNQLQPTHLVLPNSIQTGQQLNKFKAGNKLKGLRQSKSTLNSPKQISNENASLVNHINEINKNYLPQTQLQNLIQYQSNIDKQPQIQKNSKGRDLRSVFNNNNQIEDNQRILFDKNKVQTDNQNQFIDNLKNKQKIDSLNNSLFSSQSTGINKQYQSSNSNQQIIQYEVNRQQQSSRVNQQIQLELNYQQKSTGFNQQMKQIQINQLLNQNNNKPFGLEKQIELQNNRQYNQNISQQNNNPSQIQQKQLLFQRKSSSNLQNDSIDISNDLLDQKEQKINDLQRISDLQRYNIVQLNNNQKEKKNNSTFSSILQDQQKELRNLNHRSNTLNQNLKNKEQLNSQFTQSNFQSKPTLIKNTSSNSLLNNQQYSSQPGQKINLDLKKQNDQVSIAQNQIQSNQNQIKSIQFNYQKQIINKQSMSFSQSANQQFKNQQSTAMPQQQSLNIIDTNKMANQWINGQQKTLNFIINYNQNCQRNVSTLDVDLVKLQYQQTAGPKMSIKTNKQLQGDVSYDETNESKINFINIEQLSNINQNQRQFNNINLNSQLINTQITNNKLTSKQEQQKHQYNIQPNDIKKGRISTVTGEENVTDDEDFNDESNLNKLQENDGNKYRTADQLVSPFTFKQNLEQYQVL